MAVLNDVVVYVMCYIYIDKLSKFLIRAQLPAYKFVQFRTFELFLNRFSQPYKAAIKLQTIVESLKVEFAPLKTNVGSFTAHADQEI